MTNGERIEGNRLIAEFMGFVNTTPTDPDFNIYMNTDGVMRELFGMQYHNRWDWIMPVVRRINEICNAPENGDFFMSDEYTSILDTVPLADIKSSFKVVVEFVKYYNSRNNG